MDKLLHPVSFTSPEESDVSGTGVVPGVTPQKLTVKRTMPCIVVLYVRMKGGTSPRESQECRYVKILGDVVERFWGKGEQLGLIVVIMMTDGCMLDTFLVG